MNAKNETYIPKSVMVQGRACLVNVEKVKGDKPRITTEPADPRASFRHSPFTELLPADDAWIKKYGGSDISIVAFNVSKILKILQQNELKEKTDGEEKDPEEG